MIYTAGHREIYERGFLTQPDFSKGKSGSVWKERTQAEAAIAHIPQYAVYGVEAEWGVDTEQDPDATEGQHQLLRDARLVHLGGAFPLVAFKMHPCRSHGLGNGHELMEQCAEDAPDIACWGVYGLDQGYLDHLTDWPTKAAAEAELRRLERLVTQSTPVSPG